MYTSLEYSVYTRNIYIYTHYNYTNIYKTIIYKEHPRRLYSIYNKKTLWSMQNDAIVV